ncbi:MAG: S8 family serine peptidase [Caldilineaceae bacterium]|nr:S8 family serine peptidase [Caldilineaceae bacterium]
MLLRRLSAFLILALLLSTLLPVAAVAQIIPGSAGSFSLDDVPDALRVSDGTYYKPGEVLVALRDEAALSRQVQRGLDIVATEALDVRGVEHLLDGQAGSTAVTGRTLTVPAGEEWAVIVALRQDPGVLFAQPNWVISAAQGAAPETPYSVNDPLYRGEQWYLQRIQAARAWPVVDAHAQNDERVRVAVIDSGVDGSHPDFGGRVAEITSYVRDAQGNLIRVDDFGHGTHIASLIGATRNNERGIAGVAPGVRIDPYKVLNWQGNGYISDAAAAIRAAADKEADIINMSFSIKASIIDGNPSLDNLLHSAIYYAADKDALLIAASGNFASEPVTFPAAYPEVMTVAATDYQNERAAYSAQGSAVELAAPGGTNTQPMAGAWPVGLPCPSTVGGLSGYCNKYGTSFSTGLVSGAAALLLNMDPSLTAAELRALLIESAAPLNGTSAEVGAGLLNLPGAVRSLLPAGAVIAGGSVGLSAPARSAPMTHTLLIRNESSEPATWTLSRPADAPWLVFSDYPNQTRTINGTSAYDHDGLVTLLASPGALEPGVYSARLTLTVSDEDNQPQVSYFDVKMALLAVSQTRYLPFVAAIGSPENVSRPLYPAWETPNAAGRTVLDLSAGQSVSLPLPFSFPLGGRNYTDLRVHADGYLTFPAAEVRSVSAPSCLPAVDWPNQAVYGWWARLNPGAEGARISAFRTVDGSYVVEFDGVPSLAATASGVATFQMVLHGSGAVSLNYRALPGSMQATTGVEALDGRLFNLVHCQDGSRRQGLPPVAGQSLYISTQGVY